MDSRKLLTGRTNHDLPERAGDLVPSGPYGYSPWIGGEPSVGQYWRIILKRKWTVVSCLVIVLTLATMGSLRMTRIYDASGRIALNPQNPEFLGFKTTPDATSQDEQADLQTQVLILQSDALALQVARKLHADDGGQPTGAPQVTQAADDSHEAAVIAGFRSHLRVVAIPNTRIIEVRYSHPNPRFAADAVNTLINTYIEQNLKTKFDSTMKAAEWLSKQLADLQIKVEASQEKLVGYQKEHEILGTDEKQNIVTSKLDEINKELTAAEADRIQKESLYQLTLNGNLEALPMAERNPVIDQLRQQETTLQAEAAQLATHLGPSYPKVAETENRLKQVRSSLQVELRNSAKRVQGDYAAAVRREEMLRKAFEEQKKQANSLNENAIEYSLLKREAESNRQLYDGLLQKLKEAGISAGLNSNNIRIVDLARVPTYPSRPNIPRNVELAFLLGLTGGIALAFALEAVDNTVRTPDEVENIIGLPSLGMIPLISTVTSGRSARRLLNVNGDSKAGESASLIAMTKPHSEMSEAYRALRTQILLSAPGAPPKIILVTSALPEEGKTTTALNCAIVLAQQGRRVLLVDADFRRPSIHKKLGLRGHSGLANVLTGGENLASVVWRAPQLPNLWILPTGSIPPHPAELLGSEQMREMLESWRQEYDHVIVDSPPVLSVTDAVLLAPSADTVILVVRSGATTKTALHRSRDLLTNVKANIMGVVVNAVNLSSPDYYYYYYSGAKYGGYYAQTESDEEHSVNSDRAS